MSSALYSLHGRFHLPASGSRFKDHSMVSLSNFFTPLTLLLRSLYPSKRERRKDNGGHCRKRFIFSSLHSSSHPTFLLFLSSASLDPSQLRSSPLSFSSQCLFLCIFNTKDLILSLHLPPPLTAPFLVFLLCLFALCLFHFSSSSLCLFSCQPPPPVVQFGS